MKYSLSLKSDIFAEAVENFDVKLRDTLAKLLKQRDADASVRSRFLFIWPPRRNMTRMA